MSLILSDLCFIYAVIRVHCMILPSRGKPSPSEILSRPLPFVTASIRCGEGVPCGDKPHALGEYGACRDYGAAPPRDNCLFLSALASILAATTQILAMIRRRSITSAVHQLCPRTCAHPLCSFRFQRLGDCSSHVPYLEPFVLHCRAPLPRS